MSRYTLEAIDSARYTVIVGWDNPLQTFFGQVFDRTQEGHDDDCVFWAGTEMESIRCVGALSQAMSAYVVVPDDIATQLEIDQLEARPLTPLQMRVHALFEVKTSLSK